MAALALLFTPFAEGQSPENISVVLIIDNSGSMAATDPASLRFAAASQLVDLLEDGDEVSVILFADDSVVLVPLTEVTNLASKEAIKTRLTPVIPGGNTNMRAGLAAGLAELEKGSSSARFGIFLTDGELHPPGWPDFLADDQEAEQTAVIALAASFGERGWGLFPISLASAVQPEFLQKLAEEGRGLYREAKQASELTLAFQEVFAASKLDVFEVLLNDCVAAGEERSVSFPVHRLVSSLSLFVTYTSDLRPAVTVAGPGGQLATPTGGDIRYDAYSIENPERGTWTVTITGAAEGESCVSISSTPRTLVEVVWLRPPSSQNLAPNEPLEIAVRLTALDPQSEEERPVEDAVVTVTVAGPDGQSFAGALDHTGSGEYVGTVDIDGKGGSYSIALVVEAEEGVIARRSLEAFVSPISLAPSPAADPGHPPAPESADSESGGRPGVLLISLGPAVLIGLAASFLGYSHFGRPTLSGWLTSRGALGSPPVRRRYDLEARHRRTWSRRALTIGRPKDDIDLGLDKRAARLIPRRGGHCFLQAMCEGGVEVDGQPLERGQRRRLYDDSEITLGGVSLVYRRFGYDIGPLHWGEGDALTRRLQEIEGTEFPSSDPRRSP